MKSLLLLLSCMLTLSAFGISEIDYKNQYKNTIDPFRDTNFIQEFFYSFDGKNKNCIFRPKNKINDSAILILPGRMEPAIKYFELIYDLKDLPFDFFVVDHRGQAFSDRLLPDGMKGHIVYFDNFTKDVELVFQTYLKDYKSVNIISHSMGGAIHFRTLQNYPLLKQKIHKNISIAPMLDINFAPYKAWQAIPLLHFMNISGQGEKYVPGGKPFNPNRKFVDNKTTNSEARWNKALELYLTYPELQMGSTTNKWTLQSHKATNTLFKRRFEISDIDVLIFEAGDDSFVTNKRNDNFCKSIEKCQRIEFPDAKHAIHNEKDQTREKFLMEVRKFLK
jgi:lysophospholipase